MEALSMRENISQCAESNFKVSRTGAFRDVAEGVYTEGARSGFKCAVKWFRQNFNAYEERVYANDDKVVNKAIELVAKFNFMFGKVLVKVNRPSVWSIQDGERKGHMVLVEPFIENWTNFNSNSGWTDFNQKANEWHQLAQALSHFSFHASDRAHLLCDLQGAIVDGVLTLGDPAIHSKVAGAFGPTDLGDKGLNDFFASHTCTDWCKCLRLEPLPAVRKYYPNIRSTTMCLPQVSHSFSSSSVVAVSTNSFRRTFSSSSNELTIPDSLRGEKRGTHWTDAELDWIFYSCYGRCFYCDDRLTLAHHGVNDIGGSWQVDHYFPQNGGETLDNRAENLVAACVQCNREKSNQNSREFWWEYFGRKPRCLFILETNYRCVDRMAGQNRKYCDAHSSSSSDHHSGKRQKFQ